MSQLRQSVFSEQRKESWRKMATSFHTGHVHEGFVERGLKGLLHSMEHGVGSAAKRRVTSMPVRWIARAYQGGKHVADY